MNANLAEDAVFVTVHCCDYNLACLVCAAVCSGVCVCCVSFYGNQLTGTLPSAVLAWMPATSPQFSSNCITGCFRQYVGCGGTERPALVDLYVSTAAVGWKNNTGWLTNTSYCGWFGVTCTGGAVM